MLAAMPARSKLFIMRSIDNCWTLTRSGGRLIATIAWPKNARCARASGGTRKLWRCGAWGFDMDHCGAGHLLQQRRRWIGMRAVLPEAFRVTDAEMMPAPLRPA